MGITASEILQASESGRVLTVFCDDVYLARQHVRLAAEEQQPAPTLVGLEWEAAPALTHEIDEIRDALADAALSLWPSWYTTVAQRFHDADTTHDNNRVVVPQTGSVSRRVSEDWLQSAWELCRAAQLPLVKGRANAIQVQQLALAIDPQRLLCVLSVASDVASDARIRGVARAAEWLAHEARTRTILLVPTRWQGNTELDHVTYGAVVYDASFVERSALSVTPATNALATSGTLAATGSRTATTSALLVPEVDTSGPSGKIAVTRAPLDGTSPLNQAVPHVSVGPICGRPHPKSNVEKLVYQRLQEDTTLTGMFECNQPLVGLDDKSYLVDLVWRKGRLIVELDGPEHHSQSMYNRDRQRDYALMMRGYRILRITNAEVDFQEAQALEKIRNMVQLLSGKQKGKVKHER